MTEKKITEMKQEDALKRLKRVMIDSETYFYKGKEFTEDEINQIVKYGIEPDTEINVLALDSDDGLDYINGFMEAIDTFSYFSRKLIEKECRGRLDDDMIHEIINRIKIFEMDYQLLHDRVADDIFQQMECHEASKHFEDYMNEPECQTSDIEICRNNHPQRNGDCAFCTEVCCPQSSINEV